MYIIIPSYEPDQRLVDLVLELKQKLSSANLIIVNDGSSEEYQTYFQKVGQLGAVVLEHFNNKGKGAALKTAVRFIQEKDQEAIMVTVDSDGQHLVPDILRVAQATQKNPDAITLGVRAFVGNVPLRSRFGNKVTALLFRLVTGQAVSDTQTGLRGFSTKQIPWLLQLDGERFEYEFNMLLEVHKSDYTIKEVPIETVYLEDNKSSHFRPVQDSLRIYAPFLKFSSTAIMAAMIDALVLFLLMALTKNLLFSVITARVISATSQCLLNANLVFKKTNQLFKSMMRYFMLVLVILACNYFLMKSLVAIGIWLVVAKILTESLLFVISYRVQREHIFV
ncbi:glycosyltransferase [Streptococcus pneumoniae]|nr:glycosyltransferase [Streptococcus pneumoniae]